MRDGTARARERLAGGSGVDHPNSDPPAGRPGMRQLGVGTDPTATQLACVVGTWSEKRPVSQAAKRYTASVAYSVARQVPGADRGVRQSTRALARSACSAQRGRWVRQRVRVLFGRVATARRLKPRFSNTEGRTSLRYRPDKGLRTIMFPLKTLSAFVSLLFLCPFAFQHFCCINNCST